MGQKSIENDIQEIVADVEQRNFGATGEHTRLPGYRTGFCEIAASDIVKSARDRGIPASVHFLPDLNVRRGGLLSAGHWFAVVGVPQEELYLVDVTVFQFEDERSTLRDAPIVTESSPLKDTLRRYGYFHLTDDSLNGYLDLLHPALACNPLRRLSVTELVLPRTPDRLYS